MNKSEREIPSELKCTICMELFNDPLTTNCGHTFCKCCIVQWKQSSNKCPICSNRPLQFQPSVNFAIKSLTDSYRTKPPAPPAPSSPPSTREKKRKRKPVANSTCAVDSICDRCTEKILGLSSLDANEDFASLLAKNTDLLCTLCRSATRDRSASVTTAPSLSEMYEQQRQTNVSTLEPLFPAPDSDEGRRFTSLEPPPTKIIRSSANHPLRDGCTNVIPHMYPFPFEMVISSSISSEYIPDPVSFLFANGRNDSAVTSTQRSETRLDSAAAAKKIPNSRRKTWCPENNRCKTCKQYEQHRANPDSYPVPRQACLFRPTSEKATRRTVTVKKKK